MNNNQKCCKNCKHLVHQKCELMECLMQVNVRVLDEKNCDISSKVDVRKSMIIKDAAVSVFCCNQYE